jgi:hypothetical protein
VSGNNDSAFGVTIPLIGASQSVTLTPTTQAFGSVNVGSPSSPQTFTLTNNSSSSATSLTIGNSGGNSADFAISSNTCTSTLAASASCTLVETMTPSAGGARTTTLQASYSGADGALQQDSVLTGTGVSVTAATPSCLPAGGTFPGTTPTIVCTVSGGAPLICWNTSGYQPIGGTSSCPMGSTHYTSGFTLTATSTLFVWAGGSGFTDSATASYPFTISPVAPPATKKIYVSNTQSQTITTKNTTTLGSGGTITIPQNHVLSIATTCTCNLVIATGVVSGCVCPQSVSVLN